MKKKVMILGGLLAGVAIVLATAGVANRLVQHERSQAAQISDLKKQISEISTQIATLEETISQGQEVLSSEPNGVYQKLKAGEPINVLVIGDSIGAGCGASDEAHYWSTKLKKWLKKEYGGKCYLMNVSMGANTSYAGYARTKIQALTDSKDYDLAIICYGQNDVDDDFSMCYESIIRAIRQEYEDCAIISVLESSQRDYTYKMQTIQQLAEYYGIEIADTIKSFSESDIGYDNLLADGTHPNDDGHDVYFQTVKSVIAAAVKENKSVENTKLQPVNKEVEEFDTFRYFAEDEFVRTDDLTWTLMGQTICGNIGIYNALTPEYNELQIYVDGELFMEYTPFVATDYLFYKIYRLKADCNVENEIKVVFGTVEQADNFRGLIFTGIKN